MRFLKSFIPSLLLAGAGTAQAASWSFADASISVSSKGAAGGFKNSLSPKNVLDQNVPFETKDSLKIILTAKEGGDGKRPHQAFLMLKDKPTGLETAFPFKVKETGKAVVEITQKDLPIQLLTASEPLQATIILASFGEASPLQRHVFNLNVQADANAPAPKYEKPLRYGILPEIHHIFKSDPTSPPKVISIFFVLAILATVPVLFGSWAFLSANLSSFPKAFGAAPVSYALFFGSLIAMEGIFFQYYTHWSLFKMLPWAGVTGAIMFVSGSKALSEVQARRLAGER